jgi:hypothetical protein
VAARFSAYSFGKDNPAELVLTSYGDQMPVRDFLKEA